METLEQLHAMLLIRVVILSGKYRMAPFFGLYGILYRSYMYTCYYHS